MEKKREQLRWLTPRCAFCSSSAIIVTSKLQKWKNISRSSFIPPALPYYSRPLVSPNNNQHGTKLGLTSFTMKIFDYKKRKQALLDSNGRNIVKLVYSLGC